MFTWFATGVSGLVLKNAVYVKVFNFTLEGVNTRILWFSMFVGQWTVDKLDYGTDLAMI